MPIKYERRLSEFNVTRLIKPRHWGAKSPLPIRDLAIPWCTLEVGESFWFDISSMTADERLSLSNSVRRYNKEYDDLFYKQKHRDGLAKAGFKWLEVARIK